MDNLLLYALELDRPQRPLSPEEFAHRYGSGKKATPVWMDKFLSGLGDGLIALGTWLKPKYVVHIPEPAFRRG